MKFKSSRSLYQKVALLMTFLLSFQAAFPTMGFALTSGPNQPELQSFEPIGSTQMVDLFTGDFTYNIPLMEVPGPEGGYPINLFYHSVTGAEEEASMVGLGWNIGIGAITRQVRGLPDDFNGEDIRRRRDMRPNWTAGLGVSVDLSNAEFFGADFDKIIKDWLSLSNGYSLLYNSYKGFGISASPGIQVNMGMNKEQGIGLSMGLGLDFNTLEGPGVNGNVSLSTYAEDKEDWVRSNIGLGFRLNSLAGLRTTLSHGLLGAKKSENGQEAAQKAKEQEANSPNSALNTFTAELNRENPSFNPTMSNPIVGENISLDFKGGVSIWGGFSSGTISGFYTNQRFKDRDKDTYHQAYGYLYAQNAWDRHNSIMDFNREKDGAIITDQPNLPIPVSNPDILTVVGHGLGGMYRAHRSDVGIFRDPYSEIRTLGRSVELDVGAGTGAHIGAAANQNGTFGETRIPELDAALDGFQFKQSSIADQANTFEPFYFKAAGELSADLEETDQYLGQDHPVRLTAGNDFDFGNQLQAWNGSATTALPSDGERAARKTRSSAIQGISNRDLLNGAMQEILPAYNVQYYEASSQPFTIDDYSALSMLSPEREINDQMAGYTSLSPNGVRWNFALPVMNEVQREVVFSVPPQASTCITKVDLPGCPTGPGSCTDCLNHKIGNGSDDYLDITETPAYAHAHLLTSVLGADYIDVNQNGPDDADRGYWMRVDYVRTSDRVNAPYQWRTPYSRATYLPGLRNESNDDKGSYIYGEREQFYPAKITTTSHVAEFYYSQRDDGRGVNCEFQGTDDHGAYSYQLDKIVLFSKGVDGNQLQPMKTVEFEYAVSANELCTGVPNNAQSGGGKLTLQKVFFTYENNSRGALSPYEFEYGIDDPSLGAYQEYEADRWGVYHPAGGYACENIDFPYTQQIGTESDLKNQISVWHLNKIHLPSGAAIEVEAGRDHYAYLQDRVAGQLFNIYSIGSPETGINNQLPKGKNLSPEDRRIYFELEQAIPRDATNPGQGTDREILAQQYINDLHQQKRNHQEKPYPQMYFRINVDVANNNISEDVAGYVDIEDFGFDDACTTCQTGGEYTIAYLQLRDFPIPIKGDYYHPMLVAAWQFVKQHNPSLLLDQERFQEPDGSNDDIVKAVKRLGGQFRDILTAFQSYYIACKTKNFGRELNLSKSHIRLQTPDRKKFGGNIRVEKITFKDDWAEEETPVYGNIYDYTTEEYQYDSETKTEIPTGRLISSGVALNEPAMGNDESALKYAKNYIEDLRKREDHLLTFEYPVNESYYPGASVGYSKVTVKSLAADYALQRANGGSIQSDLPADLPTGFATSGQTVHEFYTAKDFPVITKETPISSKYNNFHVLFIPFIGKITDDTYYGAQGYTIELNDMHGKPKRVSTYAQYANGEVSEQADRWVAYDYFDKEEVYTQGRQQRLRRSLENEVRVIHADLDRTVAQAAGSNTEEIGVTRELFMDARHSKMNSFRAGIDGNVDILQLLIPVPVPVPWPDVQVDKKEVRTAVTNKVIRRSGVLKSVQAFDGQSTVVTENLAFDPMSGQPILTSVNNSFDDPVFSYSLPAHFAYDGMGPAYQNQGLRFNAQILALDNCVDEYEVSIKGVVDPAVYDALMEGDEFIVGDMGSEEEVVQNSGDAVRLVNNQLMEAKTKATLIRKTTTNELFFDIADLSAITSPSNAQFFLYRSGRRNHLTASMGTIVALEDPSQNRSLLNPANNATVPLAGIADEDLSIPIATVDQVLNANAVQFCDNWEPVLDASCNQEGNAFESGQRGIWRPSEVYTYVEDRLPSAPSSGTIAISQQNDGTFDGMPVFDWRQPFFTYTDQAQNWKATNQITKYDPNGTELENRDILGNYSAAIYGYHDQLAVAVGSNTSHLEMGYEGFEHFPNNPGSTSVWHKEGNLDFYYFQSTGVGGAEVDPKIENSLSTQYQLLGGVKKGGTAIYTDKPFRPDEVVDKATLVLKDAQGQSFNVAITIGGQTAYDPSSLSSPVLLRGNYTQYTISQTDHCELTASELYSGKLLLNYCYDQVGKSKYNAATLPARSSDIAHTGRHSLKVVVSDGSHVQVRNAFRQRTPQLIKDQKYVISAWVHRPNFKGPSYVDPANPLELTIDMGVEVSGPNNTVSFQPAGPIIEGWQRIEGSFTYDGTIWDLVFEVGTSTAYFDDIRLFPARANMQSYVYNPNNYRLTEVLDRNNYFTRYIYDSQGQLRSVMKETERGLKSIQETGSYAKNTAQ